jgi:phospholipase A1
LSRPFRETNYQPELVYAWRPPDDWQIDDWRLRLLTLAFLHESNGQSGALSRSWNRVYAQAGIEKSFGDGLEAAFFIRPWVRVKEKPAVDENPDITTFLGHGDITAVLRNCGHTVTMMGRGNARTGKGAFQATYSSVPVWGPLKIYMQFFTGYGESLIDYNRKQTTVGLGFTLNDILDDPPGTTYPTRCNIGAARV